MQSLLIPTRDALPDAAALAALRASVPAAWIYLRIDAAYDLAGLTLAPDGIAAPVESGLDLARLGNRFAVHEAEAGLPHGATRILALIGSAAGVIGLSRLAGASPRLSGLAWDAEALARDLGLAAGASGAWPAPIAQARASLVLAARAAGVPAFDAACRDPADLAGAFDAARRDGFAGLVFRDPAQAAAVAAQPRL